MDGGRGVKIRTLNGPGNLDGSKNANYLVDDYSWDQLSGTIAWVVIPAASEGVDYDSIWDGY